MIKAAPEKISYCIYLSTVSPRSVANDHERILKVSRRNNANIGVTGLLMQVDGSYLQYIEGPMLAVEGLMATIAKDPRHSGLQIVARGDASERAFPDWTMGYHCLPAGSDDLPEGLFDLNGEALEDLLDNGALSDVVTVFMRQFYRGTAGRAYLETS